MGEDYRRQELEELRRIQEIQEDSFGYNFQRTWGGLGEFLSEIICHPVSKQSLLIFATIIIVWWSIVSIAIYASQSSPGYPFTLEKYWVIMWHFVKVSATIIGLGGLLVLIVGAVLWVVDKLGGLN